MVASFRLHTRSIFAGTQRFDYSRRSPQKPFFSGFVTKRDPLFHTEHSLRSFPRTSPNSYRNQTAGWTSAAPNRPLADASLAYPWSLSFTDSLHRSRTPEVLPNVQDEPRPWLARAVLLGARIVTAMVVGSGALLGCLGFGHDRLPSKLNLRSMLGLP
jgi:hypothetical protein